MPAFQHARNFVLSNPVFTDQNYHYQSPKSGIDILRESSAPEAAFDSDSRRYAPSCFPGTRSQYIEDILNWATAQSAFPIYRMTGPAGVGKSAIAQTCAEELRSRFLLGASFFFTIRGCSDYARFFPSISYQLSAKSPDFHELLDKKLQIDHTLVRKQLRSQFRELIAEPLLLLGRRGKRIRGGVILIDGLDECTDKDAQREIIEIVVSSVATGSTPFYWLFFSRPEPQIEAAFADHRVSSLSISAFLPVSRGIDGEIDLYLRSGLQDILHRRGITSSVPWPSEEDMDILVSTAEGLYIYAATVLRFVGRTDTQYDPQELLRMVINASLQRSNGGSMRAPFKELDAFYTLILQRVPNELHSSVLLFLSLMVFDHMNGNELATTGMRSASNMLMITEAKTKMLCGELVAVIHHTRPNASHSPASLFVEVSDQDERLGFYHKSFFDFLRDPTRSGSFCVATSKMRNKLFEHLLAVQTAYSHFYPFQSNRGLILAANASDRVAEVHEVLSWRFDSELYNSAARALVFELVGTFLLDKFFPYNGLDDQSLRRFGDVDHRKYLMIQSSTFEEHICLPGSTLTFRCVMKNVQGTFLCSVAHRDMLAFDSDKLRKGISRLEEAQVIQRYEPSPTTLELPLFRHNSDGEALSGLYIKGRGHMSTFWYWSLDSEMKYYREFETADLSEGERIFRDENFELWPDQAGDWDEDTGEWSLSSLSIPDGSGSSDGGVQWYST